jgi:hypothetical protein
MVIVELWSDWSLARILTLILGIGYLMIWLQVTVWHWRGKFHRWQMWIPVIALPVFGVSAILLCLFPSAILFWTHASLSVVAILAGKYGGFLHIKAIKQRTGGFKLENFMSGPPFVLPFTIAAFGLMNLIIIWY